MTQKKRRFVSLVGQTAMGTLQPFLACRQYTEVDIGSIELLATPKVVDQAAALRQPLSKIAPGCPVTIRHISGGLEPGSGGLPPVTAVYRELEQHGSLLINLMGGTNFLGAAGLCALARPGDHLLVQALNDHFGLIDPDGEVPLKAWPPPKPMSPQRLLEVQGLVCGPPHTSGRLPELCREHGLELPSEALCGVEIGGWLFDCVWNPGNNVLNFLWLDASRLAGKARLAELRELLNLVTDKKRLGHLFTRTVHVLTRDQKAFERLRLEGGNKIKPWCVHGEAELKKLEDIFKPWKAKPRKDLPRPEERSLQPLKTLVVVSGPSTATLQAILSHQCPQVILAYTHADDKVRKLTEKLRQRASLLGLENVLAWPTTHEAWDLLTSLPQRFTVPVEVNITPGTKAHGAALALWARKVGASVWGFNHDRQSRLECLRAAGEPLDDRKPETKPCVPVSLKTHLEIYSDAAVLDWGWGREAADWDHPCYDRMLEFMRLRLAHGVCPKDFMPRIGSVDLPLPDPVEVAGFSLREAPQSRELAWPEAGGEPVGRWVFSRQMYVKRKDTFKLVWDGTWLEKVAAKAISRLNPAWDIRVGVKMDWLSPGTNEDGSSSHLTERDVLVSTDRGLLYYVSCKAYSPKAQEKEAAGREALAVAKVLGRFTIPLLLTLDPGKPDFRGEVPVFGWHTLSDGDKLRSLWEMAESKARQG